MSYHSMSHIDAMIDDFFASLSANQPSTVATYVLHFLGDTKQHYFRHATPEIIDKLIVAEPGSWHVTAVYRDGLTRDVTKVWNDAIEKRRELHVILASLLEKFEHPSEPLATYEILLVTPTGPISLDYFTKPARGQLHQWTRYPKQKLVVRAIMQNGEVKDVTEEFKSLIDISNKLR